MPRFADEEGRTPVMTAVKAAEARLLTEQPSKSYLGPEGDIGFVRALATLVLGKDSQAARLIAEAFSAVLYASGYTWFVVMLAAIHGELTKDLPRPFL